MTPELKSVSNSVDGRRQIHPLDMVLQNGTITVSHDALVKSWMCNSAR